MPYTVRKQKCKRSDGKSGNYVLKYKPKKATKKKKDSEGFVKAGCHTSKKNANAQRAAIEGGPRESIDKDNLENYYSLGKSQVINEKRLREIIREQLTKIASSSGVLKEEKEKEEELSNSDFAKGLKTGAADLASSVPAKLNDDMADIIKKMAAMAQHDRSKFGKLKDLVDSYSVAAMKKMKK